MVAVDPMAALAAHAAGGSTAANEFVAQQANVQSAGQQALQSAANSANSLQAPAAFRTSAAAQVATPFNAAAAHLGALAGAATAQTASANNAMAAYKASIGSEAHNDPNNPNDPETLRAMMAARGAQAQDLSDARTIWYNNVRDQSVAASSQSDAQKAATQASLNQAASSGLDPDTYKTLATITSSAKSLPEALAQAKGFLNDHAAVYPAGTKVGDKLADGSVAKGAADANGKPAAVGTDVGGKSVLDAQGNPTYITSPTNPAPLAVNPSQLESWITNTYASPQYLAALGTSAAAPTDAQQAQGITGPDVLNQQIYAPNGGS